MSGTQRESSSQFLFGLCCANDLALLTGVWFFRIMTEPNDAAVLIADRRDIKRAIETAADGRVLVAGSVRVGNLLRDAGLDVVRGNDLLSFAERTQAMQAAFARFQAFDAAFTGRLDPSARASFSGEFARSLITDEAMKRAQANLGQPILRGLSPDAARARDRALPNMRFAVAGFRGRPTGALHPSGAVLDFQSPSGLLGADARPRIQVRIKDVPAPLARLANMWERFRAKGRGPLTQMFSASARPLRDRGLHAAISGLKDPVARRVLTATVLAHQNYRDAFGGWLAIYGVPEEAVFNHIAHAGLAGIADCLKSLNVPLRMASHGALVAHGSPERLALAQAICRSINNTHPAISQIEPRSPMQAKDAFDGQKIHKVRRIAPMPETRPEAGFTIYAAPNFQPWYECYFGLSVACFDIVDILENLARSAGKLGNGATVLVRIKTTTQDVAKASKIPTIRGVLPDDISQILAMGAVEDACFGSHRGYLDRSDLVVTEGVTAVMFEALEARKPVLLLQPAAGHEAALPGRSLAQAMGEGRRAAVYVASIEEDLPPMLDWLDRQHRGKPLTDAEVAPWVWV